MKLTISDATNLKAHGYSFERWGGKTVIIAPDGYSIAPQDALRNIEELRYKRNMAMAVNTYPYRDRELRRRMQSLRKISVPLSRAKSADDFVPTGKACPCGKHMGISFEGKDYCPVSAGLQLMRLWLNGSPSIADDDPYIIDRLIAISKRR